jgi:tripartite-type tricarboxylate transporter receptor subunit TctC
MLAASFGLPWAVSAQQFPARPIRIIAQFTAGSSTDVMSRLVAQRLNVAFNQQVIVENRPGAGSVLGTEIAAKATPDGYTLVAAVSSAFGINPSLFARLPYDAVRDFEPIINLALTPQTLVASPAAPFKTIKELVAHARDKPGALNYASLGVGSTSHLTMEMFRAAAGIKLNHVPFKGSADAHTQLMGGQIPIMCDAMPATQPQIKAGRLRGLGVGTLTRSPLLPELPTIAESGYPGFEALGWIGLAAPAKTPEAVLDKLNAELNRMLNDAEVKERLNALAFMPVGGTRREFGDFIKAEIAKWGKAVKESGARVD